MKVDVKFERLRDNRLIRKESLVEDGKWFLPTTVQMTLVPTWWWRWWMVVVGVKRFDKTKKLRDSLNTYH
jgi:hypothetical protein